MCIRDRLVGAFGNLDLKCFAVCLPFERIQDVYKRQTQDGTPDNEVGNGWGYYDLGLHDENFILRARELGLDTLIMGIRDEKAIREALAILENELLGAVIAVGYRAINPDKPKRKTVDDILKLF